MASEHILQLKAVLDTSDVKQKLDQLKDLTQAAGTSGATGSGSASSLAGTLRNLNMTLQQLQRSIDRLAAKSGEPKSSASIVPPVAMSSQNSLANKSAQNASSPFVKVNAFSRELSSVLTDLERGFSLRGPIKREISNLKAMRNEYRKFARGVYTGRQLYNSLDDWSDYTVVENFQERVKSADNFQRQINQARRNGIRNSTILHPVLNKRLTWMSPEQKRISRQLVSLGAGVVLGGAADYANATGHTGIGTALSWGSNIGMGAGMGAMMGGPIGAGIGAAAGALQSAFQMLTESAKEAADALERQTDRVYRGQDVDNKVQDYLQQREDKAALKKNDLAYFQREANKEKTFSNNLRKQLEQGEIGFGGKGNEHYKLREYERETLRLMKIRGKDDPEMVRRRDAATMYKANVDVWMKHQSRADEMQEVADRLKKPKVDVLQSILNDHMKELQERLSGMKSPEMGNVNSLASQGFMISRSDDEARLNQQNDYLRDIANMTREIKNIEQLKGEGATYS